MVDPARPESVRWPGTPGSIVRRPRGGTVLETAPRTWRSLGRVPTKAEWTLKAGATLGRRRGRGGGQMLTGRQAASTMGECAGVEVITSSLSRTSASSVEDSGQDVRVHLVVILGPMVTGARPTTAEPQGARPGKGLLLVCRPCDDELRARRFARGDPAGVREVGLGVADAATPNAPPPDSHAARNSRAAVESSIRPAPRSAPPGGAVIWCRQGGRS